MRKRPPRPTPRSRTPRDDTDDTLITFAPTLPKRAGAKTPEAKARQIAHLQQGVHVASVFEASKPAITQDRAMEFVKLLSSGLGPQQALDYLFPTRAQGRPDMSGKQMGLWVREWLNSPLVASATSIFNGGEWHAIDADRRIDIALEHTYAQMAYFLYTTDFNDGDAPLQKMNAAREALVERLKMQKGEDSPFERMMRDLLEGKAGALGGGPPQMGKAGIPIEMIKES